MLAEPTSERQFIMYEALRKGADSRRSPRADAHQALVHRADAGAGRSWRRRFSSTRAGCLPDDLLIQAKKDGFADQYLAKLLGIPENEIRAAPDGAGRGRGAGTRCRSAASRTPPTTTRPTTAPDRSRVSDRPKIMVLGGGPNRIGQGIEFDYCCVHAAFALRDEGYESIMVNCNPETVSTDYDTSDKLYFEPLTVEDVLSIYEKEKPEGVIVQFGGQTPLNIAAELESGRRAGSSAPRPRPSTWPRTATASAQMMRKTGHPACPSRAWPRTLDEALADRRADRLPADRAALLRPRRSRHGDRARRGDAARTTCARRWMSRPSGRS